MKPRVRYIWKLITVIGVISFSQTFAIHANEPDSAYIFAYTNGQTDGRGGLNFAWSIDGDSWHPIGVDYSFIKCDYGRWGTQKRMYTPFLFNAPDGSWHCIWALNNTDGAFAYAASSDLIHWERQFYPLIMPENNCLRPEITYNTEKKEYIVSWESDKAGTMEIFSTTTKDFKSYSPVKRIRDRENACIELIVSGAKEIGTVHKVSWSIIEGLQKAQQLSAYKDQLNRERVALDSSIIKGEIDAIITLDPKKKKTISDMLLGVFFEDINYAADGGLYAELIQNRSFEYQLSDKEDKDKTWNSNKAWAPKGRNIEFKIETLSPIHENNKHYAALNINSIGSGLINEGFDGIPVKAGEKYDFSVFARSPEKKRGKLIVRLVGKNGEVFGEASTQTVSKEWQKLNVVVTAKQAANETQLEVIPQQTGRIDLDMISLFPQKTFKGRKNGLRADLAQAIADMKPRFVRFPGGCVAHGDGISNMYRWENTIGKLEERKTQRNIWGYSQSVGLGYFEYFQFCEDIGAEAVPVVSAGVPCQNSEHHGCVIGGQQGGIPMCEMDEYVQSILNLIEYANGDAKTEWGSKRSKDGHFKPFNLKYIGVGNEDQITDIFEERFTMIYNAVKEKHPEIVVIGTVGPSFEGTDYVEGWDIATKLGVPMVDEHYYQSPGWFLHNQDYYDRYDRNKSKVYLGEYATHIPRRRNNIETALCEALHMVNIERNGDVVSMTSYAPLLAKEKHTQWMPNLIYFNNTEVKPTVGYHVQKIFGLHGGNEYLTSTIKLSDNHPDFCKRVATSFVIDHASNSLIIKLVNLLPFAVPSTIDLSGMQPINNQAELTVLQGELEDRNAKPVQFAIEVSQQFNYKLPAYSFSVIRFDIK